MSLIRFKRGTAAEAAAVVLQEGEPGYTTDTGEFKIGDGVTAFAALPETGGGGSEAPLFFDLTADSDPTPTIDLSAIDPGISCVRVWGSNLVESELTFIMPDPTVPRGSIRFIVNAASNTKPVTVDHSFTNVPGNASTWGGWWLEFEANIHDDSTDPDWSWSVIPYSGGITQGKSFNTSEPLTDDPIIVDFYADAQSSLNDDCGLFECSAYAGPSGIVTFQVGDFGGGYNSNGMDVRFSASWVDGTERVQVELWDGTTYGPSEPGETLTIHFDYNGSTYAVPNYIPADPGDWPGTPPHTFQDALDVVATGVFGSDAYTPADPSDWGVPPTTQTEALDAIAAYGGAGGSGLTLSADDPEALGVADSGVSVDASPSDHVHPMVTGADLGVPISAATDKATPVDADTLIVSDSAASNVGKKLSWANLKATLKAYFDTQYPSGSGTHSGTSSGTNTGDQTITLTGDVTGTGTGSFATAIAAGAIVNADINASAAIDQSKITNLTSDLASKAALASPAFTGTPTAPTQSAGNNSTRLATTAYADTGLALKANLASPAFTGNPTATTQSAGNNSTRLATTAYTDTADALKLTRSTFPVCEVIAISDEVTPITTGTAKVTWRAPYAFTLTGVRAQLNTVSSSGIPTFDINEAGVSVLSTKLTIDVGEKTSVTALTAAVISDSAIADDAELTFDIDVAGTGAAGAKIALYGTRSV